MKKRMTRAQMCRLMARPIDVRVEYRDEVPALRQSCRLLEKAATLYGRRRIERRLAAMDDIEGPLWLGYWRRWRKGEDAHLVPWAVIAEPYQAPDVLGTRIAFTPQRAAAAA